MQLQRIGVIGDGGAAGIAAQPSLQASCEASELVISAVTASGSFAVAQEAAAPRHARWQDRADRLVAARKG